MSRAGKLLRGIAIGAACLVGLPLMAGAMVFGSGQLKTFSIPAESMAPTLEKGDHLIALMDGAKTLRRGEIILFPVGKSMYVKRIAALPGDSIGMAKGIVILNGRPVPQRLLKTERRPDARGVEVRRLAEQFPGEAAPHQILDLGPSDVDDFPEQRVPPGFLFVLGDHRDRSADSRVARVEMGVELVPVADVRGHALFEIWPAARMGAKLDR